MVRWLLYAAVVVVAYVILRKLSTVVMPVVAAAGVAYLLDGWVDALAKRGVRRVVGVSMLLVGFLLVLGVVLLIAIPLISSELLEFVQVLPERISRLSSWTRDHLGVELPATWSEYVDSGELSIMLREAAGPAASVTSAALGGLFSVMGVLAELLLVPVFAFYFLVDWDRMVERARALIPPRHRKMVGSVVAEIDGAVSSWIRGQFMVTSVLAVLYAVGFKIVGVELGLSLGAVVGLLTVIPFVGTAVGALLTAGVMLTNYAGVTEFVAIGAIFVVLHVLEAAVLTPKLVGKRVGLGEVGALFAVLAGGKLLGFTGVLLAVPIAASMAVLIRRGLRYYEGTEFFKEGSELQAAVETGDGGSHE
jgi:predicted PurR-regulated permease PerM